MKKYIISSALFVLIVTSFSGLLYASVKDHTDHASREGAGKWASEEDHLNLASKYDQKVAEQEAVIAEHEQMKAEIKNRFYNDKGVSVTGLKKVEIHCNRIIAAAYALRNEYADFAVWNRETVENVREWEILNEED